MIIDSFEQGGFYVDMHAEYSSSTEIRSQIIPISPTDYITVIGHQWSFVCFDANGEFIKIDESLGYKNSGDWINISKYTWVCYIRIELHDENGISPPQSCELKIWSPWIIGDDGYATNPLFPTDYNDETMVIPFPKALWRVNEQRNDGYAYHELLPNIKITIPELIVTTETYQRTIDWTKSMQQTFEYYTVDPKTWGNVKLISDVKSCSISRDSTAETLGSASISIAESLGECYIRAYLVTVQNGITERHPLGTFLVQTPSSSFDGKIKDVSMDAYTPLLELKESHPPIGYSILKNENILATAYRLTRENARAPVVNNTCPNNLFSDFVAETDDTWLSFLIDLLSAAKYQFSLDEMGRILFSPNQDTASLQPVWTYDDSNSSILYPELSIDHDLYGIPNVVEVLYSTGQGYYYSKAVNDDPNSPISTISRGREIVHRVTDPDLIGDPTENQIDEYAKQTLRELSSLEYTVTYSHGYCPVRLGDCVRLNYSRAGLVDVKAKVISQTISCEPGCPVSEKAVFTVKLWG